MKLKRNSSGFQTTIKKKKKKSQTSSKAKRNATSLSQASINISQVNSSQNQSQRRTYRRGPVCGVDNCPSMLYFSMNGHRTCQYGHVMSNDFEFDDDAVPASGGSGQQVGTIRRLKLGLDSRGNFTTNDALKRGYAKVMAQRKREREVLYGEKGKELYCSICQYILEWQLHKISSVLDLSPWERSMYENVVFKIWVKYLEAMLTGNSGNLNLLKLDLMSLLSIHYLALTVVMKVEIFTDDFIKMIETFELPHLNLLRLFPHENKLKKLPNYFLKRISGKQIFPENNILAFYRRLTFMTYCIGFNRNFAQGKELRFNLEFPWRQFIKKNLANMHLNQDARLENLVVEFVENSPYLLEKVRFIPEMRLIDHNTLTAFHELNLLASICVVLKSVIYLEHSPAKNDSLEQNFDDGSKIMSEKTVMEWLLWYQGVKSKLLATQLLSKDYWDVSHAAQISRDYWDVSHAAHDCEEYIDMYLDFAEERIQPQYSVESSANKTNKMKKRNSKLAPLLNMIPLEEKRDGHGAVAIYDVSAQPKRDVAGVKAGPAFTKEHLFVLYENIKDLISSSFRFQRNIAVPGARSITALEKTIRILQSRRDIQRSESEV